MTPRSEERPPQTSPALPALRLRRFLMGSVLLVLVVAVVIALCEGAARHRFPQAKDVLNMSSEFQHDPVLGMKGIPGFRERVGPTQVLVEINRDGFRDEDWDLKLRRAASNGALKILCLGDSMLYGYRIEAEDRLTEQLAHLSRRAGRPAEVFNAGIPSYGTGHEFRALETLMPRIRPDVVVLRYCPNDFGDAAFPYDLRYEHRVYTPFYDLEGEQVLHEQVPKRFSLRIDHTPLRHLKAKYVVDFLQYRLEDRRFAPYVAAGPGRTYREMVRDFSTIRSFEFMALDPRMHELFEVNKRRNFNLWKRMQSLCAEQGARFLVLAFLSTDDTATPQDREMLAFFRESGIPLVNPFQELHPLLRWNHVPNDGHPNFLDNYLCARLVFNAIQGVDRPLDFTEAAWFPRMPFALSFRRPNETPTFGDWGALQDGTRPLGESGELILRSTGRSGSEIVTVEGVAESPPADGPVVLEMLQQDASAGTFEVATAGPFKASFTLPEPQAPLLFLTLKLSVPASVRIARVAPEHGCVSALPSKDVDLGTEYDRHILGGGFYEPERTPDGRTVRWTDGDSTLFLCLDPEPRDYLLTLRCFEGFRPRTLPPPGERIRVNDHELPVVKTLEAGGRWSSLETRVPGGVFLAGLNKIQVLADAWIPSEHGQPGRTNRLGIVLDTLHVQPVDP